MAISDARNHPLLAILIVTTALQLLCPSVIIVTSGMEMYWKREGMRRYMLDPGAPIPSYRFVDYGNSHPYERRLPKKSRADAPAYLDKLDETESDVFHAIRIYFDTSSLQELARRDPAISPKIDYIIEQVLPKMAKRWSSAINVVRVHGVLKLEHSFCPFASPNSLVFTNGIQRTDLIIFVTANSEVCGVSDVLASASSCFWDQFERPIAGNIDFCLETLDLDHSESSSESSQYDAKASALLERSVATAVHEFAHILGITSHDFLFFYDWTTGRPRTPNPKEQEVECVSGGRKVKHWMPGPSTLRQGRNRDGSLYYALVTPTVAQVVRNQFDCQSLHGAQLENQPTHPDECFGSHFDERLFFTESMSPVQGNWAEILSSLTLATLHDSGWYKPNYQVSRVSPFGHGAGCDFANEKCLVGGLIPEYSQGFFCNTEYKYVNGQFMGEFGCNPTHSHIAICNLVDYATLPQYNPPLPSFQYFHNPTLGALMENTDYCPTFSAQSVSCQEISTSYPLPKLDFPLESNGPKSRCLNTDALRPVCLDVTCDVKNHKVIITVGNEVFDCKYTDQTFQLPGSPFSFKCPRKSVICPDLICPANCSGLGVCDYSQYDPVCICFDKNDKSPGCTENTRGIAPKVAWEGLHYGSSTRLKAGGTTIFTLIVSLVVLI